MSTNFSDKITVGKPTDTDIAHLAMWMTDSGEAPLISDLKSALVQSEDIRQWLDDSDECRVVISEGSPIGFGTLSVAEADLPPDCIEVCHVIIHPEWRRRFKGSQLVLELMDTARRKGYLRTVGRVVPKNAASHGFLAWLGWQPDSHSQVQNSNSFVWYQRLLS